MTEDLGLAAIELVRERLGVDDEWCVDYERGFTWWAHDLAQSVWSEEAFDDDGIVIWRLHARTDLVRRVPAGARGAALLSRLNAFSPLSCLSYHAAEPETLQLVASAYLHEDSFDWVAPLFQLATGLQVADAEELAGPLADALQAELAASAHPDYGARGEPDEMLGVVSALPLREGGSRFAGTELEDIARALMEGPSVLATADHDGLSAEFPFLDTTSLLMIETRELHPRLGSGVSAHPYASTGPTRSRSSRRSSRAERARGARSNASSSSRGLVSHARRRTDARLPRVLPQCCV